MGDSWVNAGSLDRMLRLVVGVLLLGVCFIFAKGILQVLFGLLALIALTTATVGICPLYKVFDINTNQQ
ncbi:MAG: DUF2892 domain-containing protein [Oscillochloris sp.]|nr:DUF2892 domain-containing protein [Oscillochloris sp.]